MWLDVDVTMAPLKNNYFEIALFSFIKLLRTLKTALRKQRCQFLYVVKVSVVNSYTHLENLLVWTADFFSNTNRSRLASLATFVTEIVFMSFCFCRLAVWRSKKKIASIHPFDLTVRKILHPFTCSTLPFEKIASVHPFEKMLHPFSRSTDVSNGLSSRLLSVRLLCVRPFERIMPFVHSPKGKALVLAVHSRETRNFSRETRLVSRETRDTSREKRDASRETVVTYIWAVLYYKQTNELYINIGKP